MGAKDDRWIEIAIAIVACGDQFLVGVRDSRTTLPGKAEFPGGKVEPGESPEAAAVRECLEETGLVVGANDTRQVHVERYEHGTVRLHFIDCRLVHAQDGPPTPLTPWRWIDRGALAALDFPKGNRFLVRELSGHLPSDQARGANA